MSFNILVACEESQAVCIAFRNLGFNALDKIRDFLNDLMDFDDFSNYEFYYYFNAFIFYPIILIYIFNYIIFSIVKKKTEINSLSLLILVDNQY